MASRGASRRVKRKKNRSVLYTPLIFLLVCVAMVFGAGVFFHVKEITVEGSSFYSADEIIAASGIEIGDNLFTVNRSDASSLIYSKLPYISNVSINRKFPDKVIITVGETGETAYVSVDDQAWVLDMNCKVLGKASISGTSGLIRLTGLGDLTPVIGETVGVTDEEAAKIGYLKEILSSLSALDIAGEVTWIDISNVVNPTFDYTDRFEVRLGRQEETGNKLTRMLSAVSQLAAGDSGILDLSIDSRVHFTPK